MDEKTRCNVEVSVETAYEIAEMIDYLKEHDVDVTSADIVVSAMTLAKRLGSGKWTFVCDLKHRREE